MSANWTEEELAAHELKKTCQPRTVLPGSAPSIVRPRAPASNYAMSVTREPKDPLNKTERAYAEFAESLRLAKLIRAWEAHPWSTKLRDGVKYTPDFMIEENDRTMTMVDTKAEWVKSKAEMRANPNGKKTKVHVEADARVRLMWAAQKFPQFHWVIAWQDRKTGEWMRREFEPDGAL